MKSNIDKITSIKNVRINYFYKLKQKKYILKEKLFLIEGRNIIDEAIKKSFVETILLLDKNDYQNFKGEKIIVNQKILDKLSFNKKGNKAIAICKIKDKIFLEDNLNFKKIIVLDKIQDPINLGVIIRTGLGFNFDAIYLTEESVFLYNNRVISGSQGAIFSLPVFYIKDLNLLNDYQKYLFVIDKSAQKLTDIKKIPDKMALIFGNEGSGISKPFLSLNDSKKIYIQTANNLNSFNVAISAAIAFYYFEIIAKNVL
ncbi:MAG: RNA methyltransferase [Candidatus Hepatoplasma scabrum]|nr:MAG: RNA methyltransferase [Candidatus Hepatoplasma sp.]